MDVTGKGDRLNFGQTSLDLTALNKGGSGGGGFEKERKIKGGGLSREHVLNKIQNRIREDSKTFAEPHPHHFDH